MPVATELDILKTLPVELGVITAAGKDVTSMNEVEFAVEIGSVVQSPLLIEGLQNTFEVRHTFVVDPAHVHSRDLGIRIALCHVLGPQSELAALYIQDVPRFLESGDIESILVQIQHQTVQVSFVLLCQLISSWKGSLSIALVGVTPSHFLYHIVGCGRYRAS